MRAFPAIGCFIVAFLIFAKPVHAEVLTWDCKFTYRIDADGKSDEIMNLIFKIDTLSRKAYMEGNLGIVEVDLHIGNAAFSFMNRVSSGTVQTTTVTKDGLAVHSRNTVILDEIVAAQHFGDCVFQ